MAAKKAFVLRIDPEKLEIIEKWASDEFRSINGQIEWIIDKALKDSGRIKMIKNKDLKKENNDENNSSV